MSWHFTAYVKIVHAGAGGPITTKSRYVLCFLTRSDMREKTFVMTSIACLKGSKEVALTQDPNTMAVVIK